MELTQPSPGPLLRAETPVATVTIERFADGTYAAHAPLPDGQAFGLNRGDLNGALNFARERLLAK